MIIFYFDSGTSNSRGYLLRDGILVASKKVSLGSKDVSALGTNTVLGEGLKKLYDDILKSCNLNDSQIDKIYASGMISSPYGLVELPHTLVPLSPSKLASAIYPYQDELYFNRIINIIPGAKTTSDAISFGNIDNINNVRGEEIEAMGVKNHIPDEWKDKKYIILFPGSHTHALLFEGDVVIDILSTFSGEIFHAITSATILSGSTNIFTDDELHTCGSNLNFDDNLFGIKYGINALLKHGFARSVYVVHATKIFNIAGNQTRRDMLSGIISGTVLQSLDLNIKNKWKEVSRLAIYGDSNSILSYSEAARIFTPYLNLYFIDNSKNNFVCSVEGLLNIIKE